MKKLLRLSGAAVCVTLISSAALAATEEETLMTIGKMPLYGLIVLVIVVALAVTFARFQDKRRTPLTKLFEHGEAIHSVGPDALVSECVRSMAAKRIGALIVMEGGKLAGIFTERDALNKVLAAGLDPGATKVSAVMTRDPFCIPPTTTVGDAMEIITQRRFRHLPVVDDGRVLAVISSGDLTHWMVQDKLGEVKELVDLAAGS